MTTLTSHDSLENKSSRNKITDNVSDRIRKLREFMLNTVPEIFADRALLITASYFETVGQPYIIRRAKALEKILNNMNICINDDELIVGSYAGKPRGCQIFPEYDMKFVIDELDSFNGRVADKFYISEETKEKLREIHKKWDVNTITSNALRVIPEQAKEAAEDLIFILTAFRSGVGHVVVDYEQCIKKGLQYFIEQAERQKKTLSIDDKDYVDKANYYDTVAIVCSAAINFAKRFSLLAEKKAEAEKDERRKKELYDIAQICKIVPAYPARSFWEALQSFWFVHLILHLESNGHSVSPGRFDQYMYPSYRQSLDNGIASEKNAEELVQCLWLKFFEINKVRDKISTVAFGGYPMFQNLILGGQTKEGTSAVNELSHLCLETTARVGLPQPSLSIRWFSGCPEDFLNHALRVISYGGGMPAMFNDEVLIPNMLQLGYTIEDARNYAVVGCTESTVPGVTEPWLTGGFLNLLKILELTIFNGYDPVLKKQYDFNTGDVNNASTFDDFLNAYFKQLGHYLGLQIACDNILDRLHGALCPTPFESVLIDGCMQNGKSSLEGGARYNFTTLEAVGIANVADSLAVIQKYIYEDRALTWYDFKKTLLADYEGSESFRLKLINQVPKYGNDIDYVDSLGNRVLNQLCIEAAKHKNPRGGKYNIALYTIATNVLFARWTGATPDGRKKGTVIADGGVSCSHGMDKSGLTALLKSVVKLDPQKAIGSTLLNVKLNPSLLQGECFSKICDLVKTYFIMKGQHVQFNVIDAQTLREAMKHPERYPTLTVRVAGFSVLFTTIDPVLQEDIIKRTEHESGSHNV